MLNNATPANATPLPVVLALTSAADAAEMISPRAEWAASVGRIAADVAALTFRLPLPRHLRDLFEDTVRREVAAELLPIAHLSDEERHQLEDIAWLAFDRRVSHHAATGHLRGRA